MKRIICIGVLIFCLTNLFAQADGFGLGIVLGEPAGLSFKIWIAAESALDAGLAWSFIDPASFHIHIDYLFHFLGLFPEPLTGLGFYTGIGGKGKFSTNDLILGIRIPLGAAFFFEKGPLDIFLEIVPGMDLFPQTEFIFNFGFGVRYFF